MLEETTRENKTKRDVLQKRVKTFLLFLRESERERREAKRPHNDKRHRKFCITVSLIISFYLFTFFFFYFNPFPSPSPCVCLSVFGRRPSFALYSPGMRPAAPGTTPNGASSDIRHQRGVAPIPFGSTNSAIDAHHNSVGFGLEK